MTIMDLFCGAGGSSIGAVQAGAELRIAANHWDLAVETHAVNFPDADHVCADVSQSDPRRWPTTDILLASPECTHHSKARSKRHTPNLFDPGGDPAAERSRATMWDVPRFAEVHDYEIVIVENVVEICRWLPFESWLAAMGSLGYEHRVVSVNSMVCHPTPQSRDRLYVVFWKAGNRAPDLDIRPDCWCPDHGKVAGRQAWKNGRTIGKYREQYIYRCPTCNDQAHPLVVPAAAAIDWALDAPRIGDRKRPLADATIRRIEAGLDRYVRPFLTQVGGNTFERPRYARVWDADGPTPTMTTDRVHALVVPTHHGTHGPRARTDGEPWPSQTGRQENGLLTFPLVVHMRGMQRTRTAAESIGTVTAGGVHHGVTIPPSLLVKGYGDGTDPSMSIDPETEPTGTVTTQDHHSFVATPLLMDYHGTGRCAPADEPHRTQDTKDRYAVIDSAFTVDDCGFRMLQPHEIGAAMAFPIDYKVLGTKREQVRQYGNAVTPPVATELVARAVGSLT